MKEVAAAPDAPSGQKDAGISSVKGGLRYGRKKVDSSAANSSQSNVGSLVNWAQTQKPVASGNPENNPGHGGREKHREMTAEQRHGNNTAVLEHRATTAEQQHANITAVLEGDPEDQSHGGGCLLVFNGGEDSRNLRKRRTAGESEAGEGALSQPCDVAYWRERPKRGSTVLHAWTPCPPPWFRRCTGGSGGNGGGGGGGGFNPVAADEEFLRGELLSPLPPGMSLPGSNPPSASHNAVKKSPLAAVYSGDRKQSGRPSHPEKSAPVSLSGERQQSARFSSLKKSEPVVLSGERRQSDQPSSDPWRQDKVERRKYSSIPSNDIVGGGGGAGPKVGAFVVRETGVPGKLQLLFVAKTKVQY